MEMTLAIFVWTLDDAIGLVVLALAALCALVLLGLFAYDKVRAWWRQR